MCDTPGDGGDRRGPFVGSRSAAHRRRARPNRNAVKSHQLVHCGFRATSGESLDEGMIVEMHGPHSYTGDDVVELHLHGAPTRWCGRSWSSVWGAGARMAQPGEFTLQGISGGSARSGAGRSSAGADRGTQQRKPEKNCHPGHLKGAFVQENGRHDRGPGISSCDLAGRPRFFEQVEDVDAKQEHFDLLNEKQV